MPAIRNGGHGFCFISDRGHKELYKILLSDYNVTIRND